MSQETKRIELEEVVIRFSGDSGDGMQLTGTLFSDASALDGYDISTFPDFPSEIRAPQGTVGGVSGFQVNFGTSVVNTPGDFADVLVAMNPAAVKANARFVKDGGTIIYDIDSFDEKHFRKAGYKTDNAFAEDGLEDLKIIPVPVTHLTREALKDFGLDNKSILRSKNMFALGLVCWMFNRPLELIEDVLRRKFAKKPGIIDANVCVLHAGYNYGFNNQTETPSFVLHPSPIEKGTYRNIDGNLAAAWGLLAAAERANLPLFLGSYPITPATGVLEALAARKDLGVKSFQAEDEIAGICSCIGAAFAGHLSVTSTSGPGLALKGEAIGLAIMSELPIVIVNVQRGGPSTGLPTKTEQSDLLQSLYGRNGDSPCVVIAASRPSDCFQYAFEAAKIALERMVPVILLTDGFLANGSEPWKIPVMSEMPVIKPRVAQDPEAYKPFARDPETLSRDWAFPGMKGFQHRIGGLEKNEMGNVSHDFENHQKMTEIRAGKVAKVVDMVPNVEVAGDDEADLLVVGWGGTYGHLVTAVNELKAEGKSVAHAHFNYINPLPANTADVLARYKKIVVCELNTGQFASFLRDRHPEFKYEQYNKVKGLPFNVVELKEAFTNLLEE